jgi:rhamnose transport system permease protein
MGLTQSGGEMLITLIALLVFAAFAWFLRYVAAGRAIYAVGSDAEAARLAGMPVSAIRIGVFCTIGALTALAALLNSIRFSELQSNAGAGVEIKAIAAVVVGGAAISGGRGTLIGTLLGVMLLGTIGPALTFLGINPYWEKAIQGGIILFAVAADLFTVRFKRYATVSAH